MKKSPRFALALAFICATATSVFAQNLKYEGTHKSPYTKYDVANREEDESATARRAAWIERFDGEFTPDFAANLSSELEQQRLLYPNQVAGATSPAGPAWLNIGPTNASKFQNGVNQASTDSGRLRTILQDPSNPDTVYVLVGVGGLWKTTNFFSQNPNWVPLTDAIGNAGGFAAFGKNAGVIYYGTGDPVDWGVGGSMYRTLDGGSTWGPAVSLPGVTDIANVAVEPGSGSTPDIVLAGTNFGLYRSTNGGTSYAAAAGIPSSRSVWSIVKTSAGWLATAKVGAYTGTGAGEFYLSTDSGATWSKLASTPASIGRTTLAVANPGEAVVYAFAANTSGSAQKDLYRSNDGGLTWTANNLTPKPPTNPDPYNPNLNLMNGQAWYNQAISVDGTDPARNTVYLGGVYSAAVTYDGGQSATILSSWLGSVKFTGYAPNSLPYVHADFHTSLVGKDGKGNKVIFFGSDGGIFYSVDNGKNFKSNANQGLVTHMIYAVASTPVRPDAVLIGLQDNGTRYRYTNTTTYNGSIGGDGFGVGWSQANNDISMGSVYYGDIRRWTQNPPNNQSKYDRVSIPDSGRGDEIFYTPLTTPTAKADPTGHAFFTATQTLVYKTVDAGNNWTPILDLFAYPGATFAINPRVHVVGVSPTDINRIGVAAGFGTVYYTVDGGAHWLTTQAVTPSGYGNSNSSVSWSGDNKTFYVSSESASTNPAIDRVARFDVGSGTWTSASGSGSHRLPAVPLLKVQVDPSVADGSHVFAATWIGVYETKDGGATWDLLGSGLPSGVISDIYVFPNGHKVRIATYGRGVWEINL